jgi:hypothetical protein
MIRSTIASSRALPFRALALLLPMVFTLPAAPASATPKPEAALAEALFREGRRLMSERRFAEACPKLEESQRIDPGGGTLLNLGICHASAGKTATGWAELKEALGVARRDGRADREGIAKKQLADLEPRLSRLTVIVPEEARVVGLEIKLDGAMLSPAAWGAAFPIDPGDHKVEATAPERERFTAKLAIAPERAAAQITVPTLPEARATDAAGQAPLPAAPPAGGSGHSTTQQTAAYILGGLGLGAIGIGIGFGVNAIAKESAAKLNGCEGATCSSKEGLDLSDAANQSAHISTGTIAGGAVLMAAGVVLLALFQSRPKPAPFAMQVAPVAGPHGAGALWRGTF